MGNDGVSVDSNDQCTDGIVDSGSYNCNTPITGRYVFYRLGFDLSTSGLTAIQSFRVYGKPYLTKEANVHSTVPLPTHYFNEYYPCNMATYVSPSSFNRN